MPGLSSLCEMEELALHERNEAGWTCRDVYSAMRSAFVLVVSREVIDRTIRAPRCADAMAPSHGALLSDDTAVVPNRHRQDCAPKGGLPSNEQGNLHLRRARCSRPPRRRRDLGSFAQQAGSDIPANGAVGFQAWKLCPQLACCPRHARFPASSRRACVRAALAGGGTSPDRIAKCVSDG